MILLDNKKNHINKEKESFFQLKNYNRIILYPQEKKILEIPFIKTFSNDEFCIIETNKELLLKGGQILWHNLNTEDSVNSIKVLIYNMNINEEFVKRHPMYNITGSPNKIDLKPFDVLGNIYCIKNS